MKQTPRLVHLGIAVMSLLVSGVALSEDQFPAPALTSATALPERLSETGLYGPGSIQVRPENFPFSPQYALWSDGAVKRRWLYLPPGTGIDASQPDAWKFPIGTRFWKEFSHGRPIETRLIELLDDGSWRYSAYIWNEDGSDALLAPAEGTTLAIETAPDGRYVIPSRDDCRACHEGTPVPALGVSALQLSSDRDPLAPHAEPRQADHMDLHSLDARNLIRNLPAALLVKAPRIDAPTPTARAALGYMHANCGHCHNGRGPLAEDVDLVLEQTTADAGSVDKVLRSIVGHPADTRAFGLMTRVVPGRSEESQLTARMRSRHLLTQMPPLGTQLVDTAGLALVEQWIQQLPIHEEITQ